MNRKEANGAYSGGYHYDLVDTAIESHYGQ